MIDVFPVCAKLSKVYRLVQVLILCPVMLLPAGQLECYQCAQSSWLYFILSEYRWWLWLHKG